MYLNPLHLPKAAILVLEQDPFLRAGLCSVLSAAGYRLAEGAGGEPSGRIDLVLAGIGANQAPEAALPLFDRAAPVILLVDQSAWSGLGFLDAANDLSAVAVLQRPFSRATLLRIVAQVLSRETAEDATADLPSLSDVLVNLDAPNFV
jgi:hypothetical protein